MKSNKALRRQPVKQLAITHAIRERILSGSYAQGDKLPSRNDLQREFVASRATIQQAFDDLHANGFISTNGRAGTVVAPRPPHLHRIALVYPTAPPYWSRFWAALDRLARSRTQEDADELVVFTAVEAMDDNSSYQRLLADVQAHRLAGIIYASKPSWGAENPILRSSIPQVALTPSPEDAGYLRVYPDHQSFIERSVECLAQHGCSRVSALVVPLFPADSLHTAMAARGWDAGPHSIQAVPSRESGWARNLVRLIFRGDIASQPDGLIITDDNLLESALIGMAEAGVTTSGRVVHVIAHANYPCSMPSTMPIRRLGFDAALVLDTCIELLHRQRQQRVPSKLVRIPARFENEPVRAVNDVLSGSSSS